ncbi:MAG: hypothetical protein ACOYOB_10795 [Myxococcota bacterium]
MRTTRVLTAALALLSLRAAPALAEADALPAPSHAVESPGETPTVEGESAYPVRPWLLPPLEVRGTRVLREEERIGTYGQPRWTANRRFPSTRVYVVPKGKVTVEYWNRWNAPLDNLLDARRIQDFYEIEMGLGYRLQLDLYLVTQQEGWKGAIETKKQKIELRYALADWGKLWGNPTLYLEWSREGGDPDYLEGKVLLGGELAPRWHAGANLVLERKLGDNQSNEYALTTGLSYTVADELFSVGLEAKASLFDRKNDRFSFDEQEYLAGPSISFFPIAPMHVLVTAMAGAGKAGDQTDGIWESWVIGGWTF